MENLETDYVAAGNIGRDNTDDPIKEDPPVEASDEENTKQPINEWIQDIHDIADTLEGHGGRVAAIGNAAHDAAVSGENHYSINEAMNKHIPAVDEHDAGLNDLIKNSPTITSDVHQKVFDVLRKHSYWHASPISDTTLHKYRWVLEHSLPNVDHSNKTKEDYFLDPAHIKEHSREFDFVGGRVMRHNGLGTYHELHQDGTHHLIKGTYDDKWGNQMPHLDEGHYDKSTSAADELAKVHGEHIKNAEKVDPDNTRFIRRYTEDSKPLNKTIALINKGELSTSPHRPMNDATHQKRKLSALISSAPPINQDITVHSGLSASTDPTKGQESSPGKKTAWMPAFTSTSLFEREARGFGRLKHDATLGCNVRDQLEVHIPKGESHGLYVDTHSSNSSEHEYLMKPGVRIEHDAEPKYFASGAGITRLWRNGRVVGHREHEDWDLDKRSINDHMDAHAFTHSQVPDHRAAAAKSEHALPDHLKYLAEDPMPDVRYNVATNPKTTKDILHTLIRDHAGSVKFAALEHPNTTPNQIADAFGREHEFVRKAIINLPKAGHLINKALNDSSELVREAAIKGPHAKESHLKMVANNEHELPKLRTLAKTRLGLVESEIESLITKIKGLVE